MKNKVLITEKDFQVQLGTIKIYKCSRCEINDIKITDRFCHGCGKELEFEVD